MHAYVMIWLRQELNQKVEEALACPCLDDLKEGPCGKSFVAAFSCFLKSQAEEKASSMCLPHDVMEHMVLRPSSIS